MNDEWKLSWARGKRKFPNGGYTKTILMWRNMLSTRHREKAVWLVWTRWVGSIWDDAGEVGWGRIVQKLINNVRDRYLYHQNKEKSLNVLRSLGVFLYGAYIFLGVSMWYLYTHGLCVSAYICVSRSLCVWMSGIITFYLSIWQILGHLLNFDYCSMY